MSRVRRFVSRRRFFVGVGVGAGATALPHWLAHAFGLWGHVPDGVDEAAADCPLPVVEGLSTLVLVIPHEPQERWHRGYVFGAWLNHATDEQLAPLAAVNVRCAGIGDLGIEPVEPEPWAVLMAASGRSKAVDLDLPFLEDLVHADGRDPSEERRGEREREVQASVRQIELLAAAVNGAIEAELPALALSARAALEPGRAERVDRFLHEGGELPDALLERSAAMLLQVARDVPARSPDILPLLAGLVRRRLVAREVPGSRWAQGSGCGVQIEGEDPVFVGCGMGHVPELSRRFLHFFPKE